MILLLLIAADLLLGAGGVVVLESLHHATPMDAKEGR